MRETRSHLQVTLVLAGIVSILATLALGAATIRPTEAAWQDVTRGNSVFGMVNPNAGKNYARAISGNGLIERQITTANITPARALATPSNPSAFAPLEHNDSGWIAALPVEMAGTSCASVNLPQAASCGVSKNLAPGASFASSEMSRLRIWLAGIRDNQILGYGTSDSQQPISATATCEPGKNGQARISAGGPVLLREKTELYLPQPNHQTSVTHRSTLLTGVSGVLQYHQSQGPGWAKAEARLYVTSNEFLAGFTFHVVLASAECGLARTTPDETPRPTTARPSALPESPNQPPMTTFARQTSLRSIIEVAEEQVADEQLASGPDAIEDVDSEADVIVGEAELPSLDDAASAAPAHEATAPGTTTTVSTPPATSTTAPSTPSSTEDSAPTTDGPETTTETSTPESAPASATPTEATEAQPENVTVGRWFSLTGADGVELGSAKVSDIVRIPGCGVELTLNISTSAEAGPDRWASIAPDDFAEVRSSGATRDAQRVGSECEQSANSTATRLSPGRDYEIVLSFLLDDSAERAMLRPDGTAGWIFDLPALTRVAMTSPAAPAASPAATSPSATTPSSTSAAQAETTVDPSTETAAA